jgi:hypothetical protein
MRAIAEDDASEDIEVSVHNAPKAKPLAETASNSSDRESLRPVRSAKLNPKNNYVGFPELYD